MLIHFVEWPQHTNLFYSFGMLHHPKQSAISPPSTNLRQVRQSHLWIGRASSLFLVQRYPFAGQVWSLEFGTNNKKDPEQCLVLAVFNNSWRDMRLARHRNCHHKKDNNSTLRGMSHFPPIPTMEIHKIITSPSWGLLSSKFGSQLEPPGRGKPGSRTSPWCRLPLGIRVLGIFFVVNLIHVDLMMVLYLHVPFLQNPLEEPTGRTWNTYGSPFPVFWK